jgi:TetR/AcrR family transcriptional regulator
MRDHRTGTLAPTRERLLEAAKAVFAERGYEATSTMAICRLAGTSESQLIKHFGGKRGILQAIFEYAWEQINPAVRLATESIAEPREKLRITLEMALNFLAKDEQLRSLFLLEARRVREDGHLIVLVPGFLQFVELIDGILGEIAGQGKLSSNIHPQAFRSALMGAIEGMLRDQLLSHTSHFPATYTEADVRTLCSFFINCCIQQ